MLKILFSHIQNLSSFSVFLYFYNLVLSFLWYDLMRYLLLLCSLLVHRARQQQFEVIYYWTEASVCMGLSSFVMNRPPPVTAGFLLNSDPVKNDSFFFLEVLRFYTSFQKTEWRKYYSSSQDCALTPGQYYSSSQDCVLTPGQQLFGSCYFSYHLTTVSSREFSLSLVQRSI